MVNAVIFAVFVIAGIVGIAGSVLWVIEWHHKLSQMRIYAAERRGFPSQKNYR